MIFGNDDCFCSKTDEYWKSISQQSNGSLPTLSLVFLSRQDKQKTRTLCKHTDPPPRLARSLAQGQFKNVIFSLVYNFYFFFVHFSPPRTNACYSHLLNYTPCINYELTKKNHFTSYAIHGSNSPLYRIWIASMKRASLATEFNSHASNKLNRRSGPI